MTQELPAAMIHVDLDGLAEIAQMHGWATAPGEDPIFQSGMRAMLDLFEQHSVRATLFVVARDLDDATKLPLLQEARDRGHEIASHTVSHPDLLTLDETRLREEVFESKRRLEEALDVPVPGFRAPGYRLDRRVLELLSEAGYEWDASAFPTRQFSERFEVPVEDLELPRAGIGGLNLLELPLPDHRPGPIPFNPSYAHLIGLWYLRWGLARTARRRRPLVLLFHLIDFAAPLARGVVPGVKGRVFTLSVVSQTRKLRRCKVILDEVRDRFRIVPTRRFLERNPGGTGV